MAFIYHANDAMLDRIIYLIFYVNLNNSPSSHGQISGHRTIIMRETKRNVPRWRPESGDDVLHRVAEEDVPSAKGRLAGGRFPRRGRCRCGERRDLGMVHRDLASLCNDFYSLA